MYTQTALDANIRGHVELAITILANGTVGDVRVSRSLDAVHGLDQEAVNAAKLWLFRPAMLDGVSVPMSVTLILTFNAPQMSVAVGIPPEDEFARGAYALDHAGLTRPLPRDTPRDRGQVGAPAPPTVDIDAVILEDGTVGRARTLRVSGVSAAAADAARLMVLRWKFAPGMLAGRPVPVVVRFTIDVPR